MEERLIEASRRLRRSDSIEADEVMDPRDIIESRDEAMEEAKETRAAVEAVLKDVSEERRLLKCWCPLSLLVSRNCLVMIRASFFKRDFNVFRSK
jgi:hypothetical protein